MAKLKTGPKVKRKGGGIPAKSRAVDALAEQLRGSTAVIVTDYRGLKVGELQELRKRLRPKRVEYHVVKNSLFTRAAAKTERDGLASLLSGPTAVALGDVDEVELAKSMVDEARVLKALKILGAYIGGQAMSVDDVQSPREASQPRVPAGPDRRQPAGAARSAHRTLPGTSPEPHPRADRTCASAIRRR